MQDIGYVTPVKGSSNTPPRGRDPQVENHSSEAFYQNQNWNQQKDTNVQRDTQEFKVTWSQFTISEAQL